jgi:hypothetical protein
VVQPVIAEASAQVASLAATLDKLERTVDKISAQPEIPLIPRAPILILTIVIAFMQLVMFFAIANERSSIVTTKTMIRCVLTLPPQPSANTLAGCLK